MNTTRLQMLAVFLLAGTVLTSAGCGGIGAGAGSSTSSTGAAGGAPLTVQQALGAQPNRFIRVSGSILATPGRIRLASTLLESYPPQPGGAVLPVTGLALDSLVGLDSTSGKPGASQVTWSDYPVVLGGEVSGGVLQVSQIPPVVETSAGPALVRFTVGGDPLAAGGQVWWVLDVRNEGAVPIDLTFSSGQRGDVILSQNGVERYRWSAGKFFTQMVQTVALAPGATLPVVLNDTLSVAPGVYELTARVTAVVGATAGPPSAGAALPEIKTTVTVD